MAIVSKNLDDEEYTVKIWNLANGKTLTPIKGLNSAIHSVVFGPNGETLATIHGSPFDSPHFYIKFWHVTTGQERLSLRTAHFVIGRGFFTSYLPYLSSNGQTMIAPLLAVAPDADPNSGGAISVHTWDLSRSREVAFFQLPADRKLLSLAYSEDSRYLVADNVIEDNAIPKQRACWDLKTGQFVDEKSIANSIVPGPNSPDGRFLARVVVTT